MDRRVEPLLCSEINIFTPGVRSDCYSVFVWVDGSKDLSETPRGPWANPRSCFLGGRTPLRTRMQPIILYKPMLALKSHRMSNNHLNPKPIIDPRQSACVLDLNYGRSLRPELMACDRLYALREVFEIVAQAELQFLGLCEARLREFQDPSYSHHPDCLPNLMNPKQLLYRHLHQNQDASASLDNMCHPQWHKASDDRLGPKIENVAQALIQGYAQILGMNEDLYRHCTEAIGVLMNEIVISESKEARMQATRIGKLPFLAFIFVPLSFTTSFFGMNVREFQSGKGLLSIWMWFVLSMPLLALAVFFFLGDVAPIWGSLKHFVN